MDARDLINARGGLNSPGGKISLSRVTKSENEMSVLRRKCQTAYQFNLKVESFPTQP